jgi:hypothetical protein
MFNNIGYKAGPVGHECTAALSDYFPILKDNFTELRKWTVRSKEGDGEEGEIGRGGFMGGERRGNGREARLRIPPEMGH